MRPTPYEQRIMDQESGLELDRHAARKRRQRAQAFSDALAANEDHMGEMAAMAVTCEQFGIDEDEGYDLLVSLADNPNT